MRVAMDEMTHDVAYGHREFGTGCTSDAVTTMTTRGTSDEVLHLEGGRWSGGCRTRAVLVAPGTVAPLLPLLVFVICPLSMLVMMPAMSWSSW